MSGLIKQPIASSPPPTYQTLNQTRKNLETEASAITDELTSGTPPMGIHTPLVDLEGYPRADIDVHRALFLRNRLAVIRTDHADIMKNLEVALKSTPMFDQSKVSTEQQEIEKRLMPKPKPKFDKVSGKWVVSNADGSVAGLEGGHNLRFEDIGNAEVDKARIAALSDSVVTAQVAQAEQLLSQATVEDYSALTAFAYVNEVSVNSPAEKAGLRFGDVVLRFGSVDATNHGELSEVGMTVQVAATTGAKVTVVVKRMGAHGHHNEYFKLANLKPGVWEGRGALGCHIIKYSGQDNP